MCSGTEPWITQTNVILECVVDLAFHFPSRCGYYKKVKKAFITFFEVCADTQAYVHTANTYEEQSGRK